MRFARASPPPTRGWPSSASQFGMFSMLPLDARSRSSALREDHAIYMADSGRFNVVGMADEAIDRFTRGGGRRRLDG